ncbi:hypothetical protein AWC06_14530 [Mycobacterium fragae]|uniref:Uncharacterized protein n=1 Tax=Mycobacterium fragae TaxID=1260918 RepID=A0A1X1UUP5_9MYCO|nr:hypothetical protein AWC06_14530 [Mycobacterium fragae]
MVTEFQILLEFPNTVAISPFGPTSHDGIDADDESSPKIDNSDPDCDVDAAAGSCSAGGTVVVDTSCGVIDAVVCAEVPAGVLAALATAAACPATPAGLVVRAGGVNGDTVDATCEAAAYPYIAAASWAHISMYCASVAMIAGVFCPKKFVAISAINNARLAAITGGGTVIANAAS